MKKLFSDIELHLIVRVWVKLLQIQDRILKREQRTTFSKVSKGQYQIFLPEADALPAEHATGEIDEVATVLMKRYRTVNKH
jgi:hypothetical protein